MPTDMKKAIKQAALLRNLIESCLKAAGSPMTGRELADWPSIKEQIGTGLPGYGRFSTQLQQLVKRGFVDKIGGGMSTTYAWAATRPQAEVPAAHLPELRIKVNKAAHSLSFLFEGLSITIEVAG